MAEDKKIVLGFVSGLSGVYGWMANDQLAGVTMAVDEINAEGGVAGVAVVVESSDDQSKPELSEQRTRELIENKHADFIIGSLSAGTHLHINKEARAAGRIFMSIGQSNEITVAPHLGPLTFHEALTPHMTAQIVGKWIFENLGTRWHLVAADYEWGRDVVGAYKVLAKRFGATICGVSMVPFPARSAEDFAAHMPEIIASEPEVLIICVYGVDQIKFIEAAHAVDLKHRMSIIFTLSEIDIIERVNPDEAVSMYWAANFYWKLEEQIPAARTFVRSYRARYKKVPSGYSAYGYSGAMELLQIARKLGQYPIDSGAIASDLEGRSYAHYKNNQWWRPCDHQSFQDIYILKLKGPEERKDADDNSEIIGVSRWDLTLERSCEELGHTDTMWGHAMPASLPQRV